MESAAFSIKNLTLKYNASVVIKDLNCEIASGKITYIIGNNGAGKSTLIKALTGLFPIASGSIKIFNKPLTQDNIAKHIGYVPQNARIDRSFPITVEEMISLECPHPRDCKLGSTGHLHVFDAEKLLKKKISDLSGGELQKVLIARALVSDPDILILDEPFNNLDHQTEAGLIQLMQRLHTEQGKTIIFVTHDLEIINPGNSDTLLLAHGKGIIGDSQSVITKHQLAKIA